MLYLEIYSNNDGIGVNISIILEKTIITMKIIHQCRKQIVFHSQNLNPQHSHFQISFKAVQISLLILKGMVDQNSLLMIQLH